MRESIVGRYVGARVNRVEDKRLLAGAGRYIDDVSVPDMLHAAFLRSPYPHARITVDASKFPHWKKLEFYDGAKKLGTVTEAPTKFTAGNLTPGYHIFSVLGTDAAGSVRTSEPVKVTLFQADCENNGPIMASPRSIGSASGPASEKSGEAVFGTAGRLTGRNAQCSCGASARSPPAHSPAVARSTTA